MKKYQNCVIVSDLDGTFLDDREQVVERNLRAIEYFKQNGGHFTVASGRVAQHILGAIPNIAEIVNLPAVTCNGSCLYDFRTGKVSAIYPMSYELIRDMVDFVHQSYPTVGARAGGHEYCFLTTSEDAANEYIKKDFDRYRGLDCRIQPIDTWSGLDMLKVVLRGDAESLDALLPKLKERYGNRISACKSWSTIIDIQVGGVNKGASLQKYVCKNLPEGTKIYACGDYINDTEMLKCADVAVCPSNAHPDIKKLCDLCLCSNNEGLIGDLLRALP